jgi:hypothetical protein
MPGTKADGNSTNFAAGCPSQLRVNKYSRHPFDVRWIARRDASKGLSEGTLRPCGVSNPQVKKRTISAAVLLVFVWELSALAQGLLPAAAGGWTASGSASIVASGQLESVADGRADVLREYGLNSAEQRQYTQGQHTVTITLYRMVDPTAAYGAFTFLRDPQMQPLDLGDSVSFAAAAHDQALFVVGNLLLATSGSDQLPADAVLNEIATTLLPHADGRPYPSIAGFLPRSSVAPGSQRFPLRPGGAAIALPTRLAIVVGSERYVLGPRALREALPWMPATNDDWMGFGKSAEAIAAKYRANGWPPGQEITLLVTLYPTQQIAAAQFGNLNKWMAINVEPDQAGGRTVVFGSRSRALVALVFGAASGDVANQLLNQIQYRTSVTWNEPSHELTDPPFSTMIVGVFEGTGLIMLLSLAAGLGFGGLRLLVKILLPGRVFDRDSDVEILQLGLSSKPINSRDFY